MVRAGGDRLDHRHRAGETGSEIPEGRQRRTQRVQAGAQGTGGRGEGERGEEGGRRQSGQRIGAFFTPPVLGRSICERTARLVISPSAGSARSPSWHRSGPPWQPP